MEMKISSVCGMDMFLNHDQRDLDPEHPACQAIASGDGWLSGQKNVPAYFYPFKMTKSH
jgi:hypothetical protein